ncbi:hypothetical protein TNCV_1107121 [Trichonephila clavipes]|nr:hypothetical protein TNCV_1107121 [Trichonephila clavipes]
MVQPRVVATTVSMTRGPQVTGASTCVTTVLLTSLAFLKKDTETVLVRDPLRNSYASGRNTPEMQRALFKVTLRRTRGDRAVYLTASSQMMGQHDDDECALPMFVQKLKQAFDSKILFHICKDLFFPLIF